MDRDDYEMSKFVIGFDGGGEDEYNGSDEGGGGGPGADFSLSPPPPKFLLPPPPLPDFMQSTIESTDYCDEQAAGFNLQQHLDTCDINYVSNAKIHMIQ